MSEPPQSQDDRARLDARPAPTRVAVVVVSGVGDDGLGDTANTVANALVREGYFDWAEHDEVTVTAQPRPRGAGLADYVAPFVDRYAAPRRRLGRGARTPPPPGTRGSESVQADIYEMNWADLSRFPSGLARFIFSLFGLVLQLGRSGIEALYRAPTAANLDPARSDVMSRLLERTMRALSWVLAFAVVPITAALGAIGICLWAVTVAPGGAVARWAIVILTLAGLAYIAIRIGRGVALSGWGGVTSKDDHSGQLRSVRQTAWIVGVLVVSLVGVWAVMWAQAGAAGWNPSRPTNLANLLLGMAAWPLRAAWIAAVVLAAAGIVLVGLVMIGDHGWHRLGRRRPSSAERSPRWRAAYTSLLSVTIAPFLLAFVAGLLLAAGGFSGAQGLGDRTWSGAEADLVCLDAPDSWWPGGCSDAHADRDDPAVAGAQVPVASAPELTARQAEVIAAKQEGVFPSHWMERLVSQILEPAGLAALILLIALGLPTGLRLLVAVGALLTPVGRAATGWLARLPGLAGVPFLMLSIIGGKLIGRPGTTDRRRRERRALTDTLDRLEGPRASALLGFAGLFAVLGVLLIWLPDGGLTPGESIPLFGELSERGVGQFVSLGLAGLLLIARLMPMRPTGPSAAVGGWLERARVGLDIGYDVTSYVREGQTAARLSVAQRYRALLAQITQIEHDDGSRGYAGIVFAAHSQGTIYTAATLFGDLSRKPEVFPLRRVESAVFADLNAMRSVSFLSFGSPIRQTYDRRFPGQYAPWYLATPEEAGAIGTAPGRGEQGPGHRFAPLNDTWLNMYRAADYVGREVNRVAVRRGSDVPAPAYGGELMPAELGTAPPGIDVGAPAGRRLRFVEQCIDVPGGHVGYFGLPEIAAAVNFLIGRAAGDSAPGPVWPPAAAG